MENKYIPTDLKIVICLDCGCLHIKDGSVDYVIDECNDCGKTNLAIREYILKGGK